MGRAWFDFYVILKVFKSFLLDLVLFVGYRCGERGFRLSLRDVFRILFLRYFVEIFKFKVMFLSFGIRILGKDSYGGCDFLVFISGFVLVLLYFCY